MVVVASAAYTLAGRTISDRRRELRDVQAQARRPRPRRRPSLAYTAFTALRDKRGETVRSLASSRFDWGQALHQVAATIPADAR